MMTKSRSPALAIGWLILWSILTRSGILAQDPSPSTTTCTRGAFLNDPCFFSFDDECDAKFEGDLCALGTDCLDCDPCRFYHLTSCGECVSIPGCAWCDAEAACVTAKYLDWIPKTTMVNTNKYTCLGNDDCEIATTAAQCRALKQTYAFPESPFYGANRWVYELIRMANVWEEGGITGKGVTIRVNDDGVDATHPDFAGRFDESRSCGVYMPTSNEDSHGTTCASIAAGAKTGCAVGIAYEATLSGCRMLGDDPIESAEDNAFLWDESMVNVDISSNSWGAATCVVRERNLRQLQGSECPFTGNDNPCLFLSCENEDWSNRATLSEACKQEIRSYCSDGLGFEQDIETCSDFFYVYAVCFYDKNEEENEQLVMGIQQGRNGKGVIYVFSSGNGYSTGNLLARQGESVKTTRYGIHVGAVGKDGLASSYSTPGPGIFISAPGGDLDHFANHITAQTGGGCYDAGAGTSYAAPVVSGVVALMLQVNPELSWRDVRGILASTAYAVADDRDNSGLYNAAGFWHSDRYGFGIVDASAAVNAAKTWEPYTTEVMIEATSGTLNIELPDYTPESDPVVTTVAVEAEDDFVVETVYLFVKLDHNLRGDLQIILTSPSGTPSLVHPGKRLEGSRTNRWKFVTNKVWGESASGEWTLSIEDEQRYTDISEFLDDAYGDDEEDDYAPFEVELLESWSLEIYGRHTAPSSGGSNTVTPTFAPVMPMTHRPPKRPLRPLMMFPPMYGKGGGYGMYYAKGKGGGFVRGGEKKKVVPKVRNYGYGTMMTFKVKKKVMTYGMGYYSPRSSSKSMMKMW